MQRRYSILILAPWDARVRRLEVTRVSAAVAVSAALAVLIAGAWFGGNFLWNQWKLASAKKAQAQREELARLKDKADDIQSLLQDWQGLREKVDSTVPADKRLGSKSRLAVVEMQQSLDSLQLELDRLIAAIPTEWPAKGKVTSGVGDRVSPWSGKIEFHSRLPAPRRLPGLPAGRRHPQSGSRDERQRPYGHPQSRTGNHATVPAFIEDP